MTPHTSDLFTINSVPYAYCKDAEKPWLWDSFLNEDLWPDDPDSVRCLQEIFGYSITLDTSQQKLFLLVGPKRSGKGTIGRVLTELVGQANVVAPTLGGLSTQFGLASLIGKQLAIISDARLSGRADQHMIAERLLSISGEDMSTAPRKYKTDWTGRLPTRFFILTNELPRLADASGALASRFIALVLERSFYGREDATLTQKLLTELPSIFNWSLDGLDRLLQRGHFLQPVSARETVEQLETLGSPIRAFIDERCEVGPGNSVAIDVLFRQFCEWSDTQNFRPPTKPTFGKNLNAAVPSLKTSKPRVPGVDSRQRRYEGIGLRTDA